LKSQSIYDACIKKENGMRKLVLMGLMMGLVSGPVLAEATEGLPKGTQAPNFRLPVVNEMATEQFGKWFGPAKWIGSSPKDPKKLVLMSFFATYCVPCKKEMPELVRLFKTYETQGLGVTLVSIDKSLEKRKVVEELAKENQVTFPVLHDRFGVVGRRYKAERLPYVLFLDQQGVIQKVHIGYTEEMKAALENEVRAGLGLEPLAVVKDAPAKEAPKSKSKKKRGKKKRGKKSKKS
jgi:thiol-disulfide isomerase/thioredoxin